MGPGRRAPRCRPSTAAGVVRGWRHEREEEGDRRTGSRRARRPPRRFRRSPTTRSSRTAIRGRWSRPTGRSTGSAFPRSTRRASSARCSTAGPALPVRAVRDQRTDRAGATSRARTSWRPRGRRPTVGDRAGRADHGAARRARTRSRRTRGRPRTTTPITCWCAPSLPRGQVEIELVCEPVFDYGRTPAEWTLVDGTAARADATGAGTTIAAADGHGARASRATGCGAARLASGETVFCSLSWAEGLASPADVDEAEARLAATARYWRDWLAGRAPGPPGAAHSSARPWHQGPHLHADRRDRRRADHVAARRRRAASATGTTATPGCATPPSRCRRCTG